LVEKSLALGIWHFAEAKVLAVVTIKNQVLNAKG
jgi:hypothetical protein